jgi:ABC-type phosphate/phosphonate transport system substrate-binding protein
MKLRLSYYPDITQHRTPELIRSSVATFAEALQAELCKEVPGHAIDVLPVVGLVKPSSYVFAHWRNPNVVPAAVALRVIDGVPGDRYFAQIFARAESRITTMSQLKARCFGDLSQRPRLGFGDPFSTANFLVPAAHLLDCGLHPFTRFESVRYCGGHDGVARAVYAGEVDVGAGHDGVIVDLARQPGFADAEKKLIRLDRVFIQSDPVAVNVDAALRAPITKALLAIAARDEIRSALDIFWGAVVGLGPTKHENYASVESAIRKLAIPEADVLV